MALRRRNNLAQISAPVEIGVAAILKNLPITWLQSVAALLPENDYAASERVAGVMQRRGRPHRYLL